MRFKMFFRPHDLKSMLQQLYRSRQNTLWTIFSILKSAFKIGLFPAMLHFVSDIEKRLLVLGENPRVLKITKLATKSLNLFLEVFSTSVCLFLKSKIISYSNIFIIFEKFLGNRNTEVEKLQKINLKILKLILYFSVLSDFPRNQESFFDVQGEV